MPQPIALFLPWLAAVLAGWIRSDKLPEWMNGMIIAIIFVVSVLLCIAMGGQGVNLEIVIGYCAGVLGLLQPLIAYLQAKFPSPLRFLEEIFSPSPIVPLTPRASLGAGQNFTPSFQQQTTDHQQETSGTPNS